MDRENQSTAHKITELNKNTTKETPENEKSEREKTVEIFIV